MPGLRFSGAALLAAAASLHPIQVVAGDGVVVTATRTAITADATLAPVSVITREDIERRQALNLEDLLRTVPGVSVSANGGLGKAASVFLRGTEFAPVLVLMDGVRVGSATLGSTAFQDIPADRIERIEVVRGPRSSLYGSEALGGVIQIFTRDGSGPPRASASAGLGSHDTSRVAADYGGEAGSTRFNVGVGRVSSDGFNACRGLPFPPGGGCFTDEPDDDGYRNTNASVRVAHRFAGGADLQATALRAEGDNEFDGSFNNESEFVQEVLGARLRFEPREAWVVTLAAGRNRDELDNFLNGVFDSRFDTRRNTYSAQLDAQAGPGVLTAGIDRYEDGISSTLTYPVRERYDNGVFIQHQGSTAPLDWVVSARADDNEQFGSHATGSATVGRALGERLRGTLSAGTAFKAPSFNELYFPDFGNPDLDPEESRSIEAGLSGGTERTNWSVNVYDTRIDELIAFDAATSLPQNIQEARIRGVEVIVNTVFFGFDVGAALTLLDPENRSDGPDRGNDLPRRAGEILSIDVDRGFGRWRAGATLLAEGDRFDDLANTRPLDSYVTVDLRAEVDLGRDLSLAVRLGNVFDEEYETAEFFSQDGRNVFVTLRYRPPGN